MLTLPTAPAAPRRRRRSRPLLVLLVAVLLASAAGVVITRSEVRHRPQGRSSTPAHRYVHDPYAPQPERNGEFLSGTDGQGYSDRQLAVMARQAGYAVIGSPRDGPPIQDTFDDMRRLAALERGSKRPTILQYFNVSFWFTANATRLAPYSQGFQDAWYLRDAHGALIPYYGIGKSVSDGVTPVGYLMDLTNPDLRNWITATLVAWMRAAPYSGVALDSADPLLPTARRPAIADGAPYDQVLCSAISGQAPCARVLQWDAGLQMLVLQVTRAMHRLGDTALYNGIAPDPNRGPGDNLGTLARADATANEAFCYQQLSPGAGLDNAQRRLTHELNTMSAIAAQHKTVLQIVNYGDHLDKGLGDFCLAEFLMGWTPGASYLVFHHRYSDPLTGGYPQLPEQDLALGNPTSTSFRRSGPVLIRGFANGAVLLNTSALPRTIVATKGYQAFRNGRAAATVARGARLVLPPRSGTFLLDDRYLFGR